MNKFENIDLIDSLRRIMETNTVHYQSDFNFDEKKLRASAISKKTEDKDLLFMSRRHGTYLFSEAEVFKKGTFAHETWEYYSNQPDSIIAYAVKVKGMENGKAIGDLYELDYAEHVKHVENMAVDADTKILHFEYGSVDIPADKKFTGAPHPQFGYLVSYESKPNDPQQLKAVLADERQSHEALKPGNIGRHISKLSRGKRSIREQLSKSNAKAAPKKSIERKKEDLSL